MARIQPSQNPSPEAQKQLDNLKAKLGKVPNIFQTFAHSPAVLDFYLAQSQALSKTSLTPALREQIALTVAGANTCDYCASAHTVMAKGQGVAENEVKSNLSAKSSDSKTQAALEFAAKIVKNRAKVSDSDVDMVKKAGFTEAEVLEIVAVVAANIFTNYFNHVVDTDIDFPHISTDGLAKAA